MTLNIPDVLEVLMPNVLTIITQLLATAILFTVLYKLLWKPVKKIMDTRSEYEQSRLAQAEQLQAEAEEKNKKAQQDMEAASLQAQEIISKAQTEGAKLKENLVEEGRQKSQQLVEEAQKNIVLQKNKMMEDLHQEVVDIAMSAAEKMLQKKLDSQADIDSINSFIQEVSNK